MHAFERERETERERERERDEREERERGRERATYNQGTIITEVHNCCLPTKHPGLD